MTIEELCKNIIEYKNYKIKQIQKNKQIVSLNKQKLEVN